MRDTSTGESISADTFIDESDVGRAHGATYRRNSAAIIIVCGDWPPGRKTLSGGEPAAILRVDPETAHLTLSRLEGIGFSRTVSGKGVYVRPPRDWPEVGR